MPGMDGTGPVGLGPGIGFRRESRGAGRSWGPGMYRGYGCGQGYGYGYGYGYGCGQGRRWAPVDTKEGLRARKEFLKNELAAIEQEIENL